MNRKIVHIFLIIVSSILLVLGGIVLYAKFFSQRVVLVTNDDQTVNLTAPTPLDSPEKAVQNDWDKFFKLCRHFDNNCDYKTNPNFWPNKFDVGEKDSGPGPYTPSNECDHMLSVPFNNSKKVLRVYSGFYGVQSDKCTAGELALVVYDPESRSFTFVGKIKDVSYAGNSGGLFAPLAITKDNKNIVLDAYMGDPGAGGGSQDYGFAIISLKPELDSAGYITDFNRIATRSAHFYDSYGKVVFVDEGDNTPHYSLPGPSNNGAIIFRDLVVSSTRKLLEEKDVSYEIVSIDESAITMKFKATKYSFTDKCPRGEDALYCASKTESERTISLP